MRTKRTARVIGSALAGLALLATTGAASAQSKSVTINKIDASGVGEAIGTLSLIDSAGGLRVEPKLTGLPAGRHGFHVHQNPNCGPGPGANGQPAAGIAAGGHYDPKGSNAHHGPHNDAGHLGDLPALNVAADGSATQAVVAPRLKLADVTGRAIVIHGGGDNYADTPAPLGGGGARIACSVVQ